MGGKKTSPHQIILNTNHKQPNADHEDLNATGRRLPRHATPASRGCPPNLRTIMRHFLGPILAPKGVAFHYICTRGTDLDATKSASLCAPTFAALLSNNLRTAIPNPWPSTTKMPPHEFCPARHGPRTGLAPALQLAKPIFENLDRLDRF